MKKIVYIILSLVLMFVLCLGVYAATYDISGSKKMSTLFINGTTATCYSSYSDVSGQTASTTITQQLERHVIFGIYTSVDGACWTTTSTSDFVSLTNYAYDLSKGTYRLRSDFSVTTVNGQSETIPVYSSEVRVD